MQLNAFSWFLLFVPILIVILLMIWARWSGARSAAASWILTAIIAIVFFGARWQLLVYAQAKAFMLAMDVIWTIWSAIMLYHLLQEVGAVQLLGQLVPRLVNDRSLQILSLALVTTTFLQWIGGFGVPVAICAPILVAMGFTPVDSVVMAVLGHSWAVTYGTMGAAFNALIAVTDLPPIVIAPQASFLLGLAIFPCAIFIILIAQGWHGIRHAFPAIVLLSAGMALAQYFLSVIGLENLAIAGAAFIGFLVIFLLRFLPRYRSVTLVAPMPGSYNTPIPSGKKILVYFSPYLLLIALGITINLISPIKQLLNSVQFSLDFPMIITRFAWKTPASSGKIWYPISHAGTQTFFIIFVCILIYSHYGLIGRSTLSRIGRNTVNGSLQITLGMLAMAGVSQFMAHTAMTNILAQGLGASISRFLYPTVTPFIGTLGAFLTGSNNNSNVLFGQMHMEAARILDLSIPLILGAQTAGASVGSLLAPGKVMVACSTVGLTNREGLVLKKLMIYDLLVVAVIAVAATVQSYMIIKGLL